MRDDREIYPPARAFALRLWIKSYPKQQKTAAKAADSGRSQVFLQACCSDIASSLRLEATWRPRIPSQLVLFHPLRVGNAGASGGFCLNPTLPPSASQPVYMLEACKSSTS